MRKLIKSLVLIAAAAMTLIACNKEVEPQQQNVDGLYKYSFTILDDATKALIGENNIVWEEFDEVGLLVGDYYIGSGDVDVTVEPRQVTFTSEEDIPAKTMVYAYFPFEKDNDDPTMVAITLNNSQAGAKASAMPLAGIPFQVENAVDANNQTNGAIQFLNLGSLVNFKIYSSEEEYQSETIKSITFTANDNIAGIGYIDLTTVTADNAAFAFVEEGEKSVSVVALEESIPASAEEAHPISMVILPGEFYGTLTVTTNAATYSRAIGSESSKKAFDRSGVRTFSLNLGKEGVERESIEFFHESFDSCDSTGGNDESWSGTVAQGTFSDEKADNEGWVLENGNAANKSIKLGAGSKKGSATTPALGITTSTATLTLRAGAWDGKSENTRVMVSIEGNGETSVDYVELTKGEFNDYVIVLGNGVDGNTKVKFEAEQVSNNRFFIDDVKVVSGGVMPVVETLTVTPDAGNPETVSYEGGVLNYTVSTANIDHWTAESSNEAFVVDYVEGGFKVTVAENEATTGRTATITVAGGSKSQSITISQEAAPAQIQAITIAQFLEKEVNNTDWYQLTGEITSITNTAYGNLYIEDATGSVYVYGLTETQQNSNNQSFSSIGLEVGDILTLNTLRADYNGTAQAGGTIPAYYVSHVKTPSITVNPTALTFDAEGGSGTISVNAANFDGNVTISASSDNSQFTYSISEDGSTITVCASENTGSTVINGTLTVYATNGTITKSATVSLSQNKPVQAAQKGDVLWAESFSGFSDGAVPSVSNAQTTVYGDGNVTYTCVEGGGTATKIYASGTMSAGGSIPELLVAKSNGSFTVSGIPTGLATKMTLTFKTNRPELTTTSTTSGVTIDNSSYNADSKVFTVLVSVVSSVTSFNLIFTNPSSQNNSRVDDFLLVVGQKEDQPITFGDNKRVEWTVGTDCTLNEAKQGLTVTGAQTTVTYSSSDITVATVANDGKVTPLKAGEVVITAIAAETNDYNQASDSYTLVITDPSATAVEYSFTITPSYFNSSSYAANNNSKTTEATATDGSGKTMNVQWTSYQIMLGTGEYAGKMQWKKSEGCIYNTTDLGTIKSVTVNKTDGSFTTYYGTSAQPSTGTTVGNGFFQVKVGGATGRTNSIVVVFEK